VHGLAAVGRSRGLELLEPLDGHGVRGVGHGHGRWAVFECWDAVYPAATALVAWSQSAATLGVDRVAEFAAGAPGSAVVNTAVAATTLTENISTRRRRRGLERVSMIGKGVAILEGHPRGRLGSSRIIGFPRIVRAAR